MNLRALTVAVFCFCNASISYAEETFKPNQGIYYDSPVLIENDRGLLCLGYSKEECAGASFKVLAGGGSTDGTFGYDLSYTINGVTCGAYIEKSFISGRGWATTTFKSGKNCSH